jgi:hypothetical protein
MAIRKAKKASTKKAAPKPQKVAEYLLGKGTSRLLDARVDSEEIRLLVNGPAMLYGTCRLLTSLDAADGATFQAWTKLAAALQCTSLCGASGKTDIPVTVQTSRIGTCIEFGTGPMSMYLATLVLRTRKKRTTFKQVIDAAFGNPKARYVAMIVPEAATGHLEHDATIFDPDAHPGNPPDPDSPANGHHDHHHGNGGHGH